MPSKDRRQHRIQIFTKKPKRTKLITVEDLFARDDVNGILQDIDKEKPNITDMIVIYKLKDDDNFYYQITDGTLISTTTWMLESTKLDLLVGE